MTAGLSATNLANEWLDMLSNSSFSAKTATYAKLHTGDPGTNGTANASAETERKQLTWANASGGSKSIQATLPEWADWDAGSETISHISVWDHISAGNFLYSFVLSSPKAVANGDTLVLTSHSISFTPIAA